MKTHYCTACLTEMAPKKITKGNIWIEIILWLVFFPVGIIYSVWRQSTKALACARCGSTAIIPGKEK